MTIIPGIAKLDLTLFWLKKNQQIYRLSCNDRDKIFTLSLGLVISIINTWVFPQVAACMAISSASVLTGVKIQARQRSE